MKKFNLALSCAFLVLLFSLCTRTNNKTIAVVAPPFKTFSLPSEKISVDPLKGGTVKMTNGTTIEIPPTAFVDASGKVIETPVTINYEQYQSNAEVIASGIPMNYDSAGNIIHFKTAGMFKINATTVDNKEVQIAYGKALKVNVCSDIEGNDFNFYSFDQEKGNWEYLGRDEAKPNEAKKEALASVKECEEPINPLLARKDAPVFDLNVDYNLYPELKTYEQTLWQCAPGASEKDINETVKNLQKNFDNIKLEGGDMECGIYKLTLYNKAGKFSANICPVIKEKDIAAAKAVYAAKYSTYEKTVKENKEKVFKANMEGNLFRSFSVAQFGFYNWDCALKRPGVVKCDINCRFDQEVNAEKLNYYLVNVEEKSMVSYSYELLRQRFAIDPSRNYKLLCIVDGSKPSVASINENNGVGNLVSRYRVDCFFETLPTAINSIEELDKFIKSF